MESLLPVIRAAVGLVAAAAVLAWAPANRSKHAPITNLGLWPSVAAPRRVRPRVHSTGKVR